MTDTLSSTLLAWLLTYAVHSTVLLTLAWVLTRWLRWSPSASDLLWKSALVGGIVTASLQLRFDVRPWGTVSLRGDSAAMIASVDATRGRTADPTATIPREASASPVTGDDRSAADDVAPGSAAASTSAAGALPAPHTLAVIAWAAVALALALTYAARRLILVGRIGDRRAVADGRLLDMLERLARDAGLRRTPSLTTTVRISSPIALGVREICVPETALTELDLEQQRSLLAHELAHLVRRDPLWLAFASLVERVLWFQPLNRLARRRIAISAEFLCDEWAVRRTGSGVALARCLAQVAEWIQASPLGVPVAGMAEERSLLVSRVEKLLDGTKPAARSRRMLALASAGVLLATIVLAPSVTGRAARASVIGAPGDEQVPAAATRDDDGHDAIREHEEESEKETKAAARSTANDSAVVLALIDRLKDVDAEVRAAAAQSLGKLEDARAVPGLVAALSDREASVRSAAAGALGTFTDARAISGLTRLLSDSSRDVRKEALGALSDYEEGISAPPIIRLLDDSDADLRQAAAHTLGQLKDRSAGAALARLVRDPSPDVRQAAIQALGELRDMAHGPAIVPALTDANSDVREQALGTLIDLRAPIAEPTLLTLMRDPDADVRAKAAELAGERSVIGAIPTLRRMLDDSDRDVREHAVSALSEIADPAAATALRAALTSTDAKVRRAAADALGDRQE